MPNSAAFSVQEQSRFSLGPDLPSLIRALQAVTQALLALGEGSRPTDAKPGAAAASNGAGQACPHRAGETRRFHLSASLARQEKELLRDAHARTVTELLAKVHADFSTIVGLMKHLDQEAEFSGFAIQMLAEQFEHSLDLLERAQSFLDDLERV